MDRKEKLKKFFIEKRTQEVGINILENELAYIADEELNILAKAYTLNSKTKNKINSAVIYCLGLSDNYDEHKEVKKSGGSAPDF